MNAVGNVPQIKLPISKTKMVNKKVLFRGRNLKAFPQVDWKAALVRRNTEPYQPIKSRLWNSSVILGMAVATIVCGNKRQ